MFSSAQDKIKAEPATQPFICDSSIKFNKCEAKLLARGPKFMVREELKQEDFELELEKGIQTKCKFDKMQTDKMQKNDKMQIGQNAKVLNISNPKYSILGVPIENQCVKGGGLLYGGFGLLIFRTFAFCPICILSFFCILSVCILSNLHFVWIPTRARQYTVVHRERLSSIQQEMW